MNGVVGTHQPFVIERYHCRLVRLYVVETNNRMQTNLNAYLEYLEYLGCYDLVLYIDQGMKFQQVVETIEHLLLTQEEIWRKYSVKRDSEAKAMLTPRKNIWNHSCKTI
jgi:hypothetical protein